MDLTVDISKLPTPLITLIKTARRRNKAHLRLRPINWRPHHLAGVPIIFDAHASPFPCGTFEQVPAIPELDAVLRGNLEPSFGIRQLDSHTSPSLSTRPAPPLPSLCRPATDLVPPDSLFNDLIDLFDPQQIFTRHHNLTLHLGSTPIDLGCINHRLIASVDLTPPNHHTPVVSPPIFSPWPRASSPPTPPPPYAFM